MGPDRISAGNSGVLELRFYRLVLGILSVWRITHLLHAEDGPGRLVVRLRERAGSGFWAEVLDCFNCLSVWVGALVAVVLGGNWRERLLLPWALSGGAILAERLTSPDVRFPTADYQEDREASDGLLRRDAETDLGGSSQPTDA